MKSLILRIAITFCLLISTNYFFASAHSSINSVFQIDQKDQNKFEKEQAANNPKRNDEAVEMLNDIIKKLEADKKLDKDKVEALKAMRDYIKKNRKEDTGTTLHKARKEAKNTAKEKDNKEDLNDYIDKTGSRIAKKVFGLLLVATGKGTTTGHMADLVATNDGDQYIALRPQMVYIKGTTRYQGFVSYIPDLVTIAPGTTIIIPIYGYCANPHVPPPPNGESMPDPSEWIPINISPAGGFGLDGDPPMLTEPKNPPEGSDGPPHHTISVYVSDAPTIPGFDPGKIGAVKGSPGFTDDGDSDSEPEIPITFPGTSEEINGTLNPDIDPETFAQIGATAITEIIDVVDTIQNSGIYTTPFSNDKEREKEAIIQQTFWIFIAALLGEEYEKEDFTTNVYQQFESATGKTVVSLPAEQKEQVDGGIDNFWVVYTATGGKAKVFGIEDTAEVPISNPEKEVDCCKSKRTFYYTPKLDFDMQIADQWANAEERRKIINDAKKSMEVDDDIYDGDGLGDYDIAKYPTSATSFWKPGVVGGFASAYAKTWFKDGNRSDWVWGTETLDTDAGGSMTNTLSYDTGDSCRAIVAGTALVRIRASSTAFDAVAGNRHNENSNDQLEVLRNVKYASKLAIEWLILRGRGKATKTFKNFVKDDLKDKIKGELKDSIETEIQNFAGEHLAEYLKALGLTSEDLSKDNLQIPDLEESLEKLLGIDIPSIGDLEKIISDGIEASLNLLFVANTYATASGSLKVTVGKNFGDVGARTSIHYGRKSLEKTKEAMTWSGTQCKEKIISDVQPNSLTISTKGSVNMTTAAISEYGFGNGSAKAYLESMNLQMLVGLCIYKEGDSTRFSFEVEGSLHWYGKSDNHQSNLKSALRLLENDIEDSLNKELGDFQKTKGKSIRETNEYDTLEKYTGEMLKNALDRKIRKWAADNPYYWNDCSN